MDQPFALKHALGDIVKERYTIRAVLGAGAFGTVYRVEEQIGARTVILACKEMHVLNDPGSSVDERGAALHMFQEEAYLLQTLRHPNIPAAYFEQEKSVWLACPVCGRTFKGVKNCPDHGAALEVVRERYYLIMDFIEGPDLEEMLLQSGRPLDETVVLDFALQICDALASVHEKGLSHRDIKPANIKVQSATGKAMLIDFGLIKPSSVAGGYGTVLKRGSTGLGTIGYAPESPTEQQHPDARTDILAFGMTLYRLLSFRDPTDPNDLAAMRRTTPDALNLQLSKGTNDLILRAIKTNPDERYADVAALRRDLQAARYPVAVICPHCGLEQRSALRPTADSLCERCGRPLLGATAPKKSAAATPPVVTANPFEPRLRELQAELKQAGTIPPFSVEARLAEINAQLAAIGKASVGQGQKCPACRSADVQFVTAQPASDCPLCHRAALQRRALDENHCAICREGTVRSRVAGDNELPCAVCRAAMLREDKRSRFGIVLDIWGVCPHCNAQFDYISGNRARLDSWSIDPFGVAAKYGQQTLHVDEWRALAQRSKEIVECDNCHAQWDSANGQWKLVAATTDPHGVAEREMGRSHGKLEWAKIGAGVGPEDGNLYCPTCDGQWDFQRDARLIKLLRFGSAAPAWAQPYLGQTVPLPVWSFASSGKTSGQAGALCPNCKTEWDEAPGGLQLVATGAPALQGREGQVFSLQDWQRIGQGLPSGADATALRSELQRLIALKQSESTRWLSTQNTRRSEALREFNELLRQSVIGGHIPIQRVSHHAPQNTPQHGVHITVRGGQRRVQLRASESVLWESPAQLCTVRVERGVMLWSRHSMGAFLVTTERVLFSSPGDTGTLWQKPLRSVASVEMQYVQNASVVLLTFNDSDPPLGFELSEVSWDVIVDGETHTLKFAPHELAALLMQKIHG
jgi:hypothetical protein